MGRAVDCLRRIGLRVDEQKWSLEYNSTRSQIAQDVEEVHLELPKDKTTNSLGIGMVVR